MAERTDCTCGICPDCFAVRFLLYWYGARDRSKRCNFEWEYSVFLCGDGMHFYHESINGRKIAGCLLGLLGVFVVNLGKGSIGGSFSFLGEGFMLCSAVSSALGSLCNKEAAKKMGPVTLCGWQLILGAVLLIGVGFLFGGRISILEVPATGWLLLLYLAFLSAVAFSLWTVLLKYNPMGRVTVFNFLIPVFGSLLSVIFLKDSLWNVNTLFALLLVCAGIYLVNREPKNISK